MKCVAPPDQPQEEFEEEAERAFSAIDRDGRQFVTFDVFAAWAQENMESAEHLSQLLTIPLAREGEAAGVAPNAASVVAAEGGGAAEAVGSDAAPAI